jgi:hypothetical protein
MNDAETPAAENEVARASAVKTVTISVTNSSPITLTLAGAVLAAGYWQQPPPNVGSVLLPGAPQLIAVNAADSVFSSVAGTLTFAPADGGSLTMSWIWPNNQGLQAVGSANSTSLTMHYSTYSDMSNDGNVQFVVLPLS